MNNIVDTKRLKAEIKRQIRLEELNFAALGGGGQTFCTNTLEWILKIIDSLQQEQESVAERFARIVRGNLTGIDKDVQQKFEQLYFEVTGNKMYGGYND